MKIFKHNEYVFSGFLDSDLAVAWFKQAMYEHMSQHFSKH